MNGGQNKHPEIARGKSNEEEEDSKPPALIRRPRKSSQAVLESMPPSDKAKFIAAEKLRVENEKNVISSHSNLLKMRISKDRPPQSELDKAQQAYDQAIALSREHSERDADDLLLGPSEWNARYHQLKAYFDREGSSHLKKIIPDADVEDMSEAEASQIRALSRWAVRQRKSKRMGDLEHYKVFLLARLAFEWDPKAGHGPDKWLKNYSLLKEFKERHGHVEVPFEHGENKLALWVKTQLTLYRNGKDGKLPLLNAERIGMLEKLGISWGVRRKGVPWEDRFQVLLDYKKRFGHVNVPWQWKENVALAQWVNSQRKKYKDLTDGKKSNLSKEQINKLNSIGFQWSTGGKGRYSYDSQEQQPSSKKARTAASTSTSYSSLSLLYQPEGVARANMQQNMLSQASSATQNNAQPNFVGSMLFGINQQNLLGGTSTGLMQSHQEIVPFQQPQSVVIGAQQALTLQQIQQMGYYTYQNQQPDQPRSNPAVAATNQAPTLQQNVMPANQVNLYDIPSINNYLYQQLLNQLNSNQQPDQNTQSDQNGNGRDA